jgi:hypothetical protein
LHTGPAVNHQRMPATTQLIVDRKLALNPVPARLGDQFFIRRGWTAALDELGYNERTAQRLVRLSDGWLGKRIRTRGTDSTKGLPVDLQKLDMLGHLSPKQFKEISSEQPRLETMSRNQLRHVVNGVLEPEKPAEAQSNARLDSSRATPQNKVDSRPSSDHLDARYYAASIRQPGAAATARRSISRSSVVPRQVSAVRATGREPLPSRIAEHSFRVCTADMSPRRLAVQALEAVSMLHGSTLWSRYHRYR